MMVSNNQSLTHRRAEGRGCGRNRFLRFFITGVLMAVGVTGQACSTDGDRNMMTIGDMIWVWGNPEMAQPGEHTYATYAQAGPAERARLLGAPNVMMAGHGLPDDWDECVRLTEQVKDLPGLAWEIGADGGGSPFVYTQRLKHVLALYDRYPHMSAVILDDMSTVARSKGFRPRHIRDIRSQLAGKYADIQIWGVVYTMSLPEDGIDDYMRQLDVILLPEWHGRKVGDFEKHVADVERRFPEKPIILCTYLWDYGGGGPMTIDLLQQQFETALRLAHEGRVAGIEITTIDNDEQAVKWTAEWIRRVADQPVWRPTAKT